MGPSYRDTHGDEGADGSRLHRAGEPLPVVQHSHKCAEADEQTGILYKSKSGYIQQSPLLGIIHTQTPIVNNLLREFGLTPSSRTRVAIVEPEKKPNRFAALGTGYQAHPKEDPQVN